jgi:hypothetical protein
MNPDELYYLLTEGVYPDNETVILDTIPPDLDEDDDDIDIFSN